MAPAKKNVMPEEEKVEEEKGDFTLEGFGLEEEFTEETKQKNEY